MPTVQYTYFTVCIYFNNRTHVLAIQLFLNSASACQTAQRRSHYFTRHLMPKCVNLKYAYATILQKEILRLSRNYSDSITYKNEIFKSKQIDERGNRRNINHDSNLQRHTKVLPSQSQIIIAGAGTVANSVAYHLVVNGWNDVLVLEQNTYAFV